MKREEAVELLKQYNLYSPTKQIEEAVDMAIEALHREEAEEKGYCHRINYIPKPCENANCDCVDVVRCKDCRYYSPIDENKPYPCEVGIMVCNKDDYCSYGERREP